MQSTRNQPKDGLFQAGAQPLLNHRCRETHLRNGVGFIPSYPDAILVMMMHCVSVRVRVREEGPIGFETRLTSF